MYSHVNPCVSVLQGLSAAPGKILWGGMNFLEPLCGSGASYWSQWGLRITSWNSWVFNSQILGQEQCVFPDQLLEHRIRWISEGPMLVNGSGPQVTSHILGAGCWESIHICFEPDMHGVCICIYCQTSHWSIQWVGMGESVWNLGRLLGRQKDVTVLKHTQAGCWVWRCEFDCIRDPRHHWTGLGLSRQAEAALGWSSWRRQHHSFPMRRTKTHRWLRKASSSLSFYYHFF